MTPGKDILDLYGTSKCLRITFEMSDCHILFFRHALQEHKKVLMLNDWWNYKEGIFHGNLQKHINGLRKSN